MATRLQNLFPQLRTIRQIGYLRHTPTHAPLTSYALQHAQRGASTSESTRSPFLNTTSLLNQSRKISSEQKARDLNQQGVDEALSDFDSAVAEDKEKQVRTPWHRQGVDEPPVRKQRSAGAMTKGEELRDAQRQNYTDH